MSEKPLHVRVAEALGQSARWASGLTNESGWYYASGTQYRDHVPRYDTDWSATGPLIEKYAVHVEPDACHPPQWLAFVLHEGEQFTVSEGPGDTPLVAVCNLLLALKEAGKL